MVEKGKRNETKQMKWVNANKTEIEKYSILINKQLNSVLFWNYFSPLKKSKNFWGEQYIYLYLQSIKINKERKHALKKEE